MFLFLFLLILRLLKLQHGGCLFDNKMMTQILVKTRKHVGKEVHQKTLGKGDFI